MAQTDGATYSHTQTHTPVPRRTLESSLLGKVERCGLITMSNSNKNNKSQVRQRKEVVYHYEPTKRTKRTRATVVNENNRLAKGSRRQCVRSGGVALSGAGDGLSKTFSYHNYAQNAETGRTGSFGI